MAPDRIPAPPQEAADLIVHGATIHSADARHERPQAFAVSAGRFAFVGSNDGARALRGPATRVLDLSGRTVLPGLVDAHLHLSATGFALREVRLRGVASYAQVVATTVAFAASSQERWIVGEGWDQNLWSDPRFPSHGALSAALPERPAVLHRIDGHALLANAAAMRLAGVTARSADVAGGRIVRAANGEPTGVFVDDAMELVLRAVPPATPEHTRAALLTAIRACHRWGVTSVGEARTEAAVLAELEALDRDGALGLRVHAMLDGSDDALLAQRFAAGPRAVSGAGRLAVRAIKLYADGALGSRGAALLAPYSDDPANAGLLRLTPGTLEDICARAFAAGFQVCTHAIGDRANRLVLDTYERLLARLPPASARALRLRVEHAQVVAAEDAPRFGRLGIIPSMQATHLVSDMPWAQERLGPDRIEEAYAWRSLLDTGATIPNGTDSPVESLNPMRTFHAAITRQDDSGLPPAGWYPAQRMSRGEALDSMTLWAAHANFQEHVTGSISAGKSADFVVIDRDVMTVDATEIPGTAFLATYLAGERVYDAAQ